MRDHASASTARSSSSGAASVGSTDASCSSSTTASSYWLASIDASARAITLSTRSRSLEETPISRNVASTPSWPASQSIVSAVGLVFPRSI